MHDNTLLVWELIPPVRIPCAKDCGMRQWALAILCWKQNFSSLQFSFYQRPLKCSQGIKEKGKKKTWKVFGLFVKTFFLFSFYHYQNLLQTHRPYSIPIKLYRASPALDCQRGPSVLIYRPRKHSTIMVINNNRIQYMTTWMMEPLRIHLHCFVLQSSCL